MKLTLASGEVFTGIPDRPPTQRSEVVVLSWSLTGQSGYEEVLTDPSYLPPDAHDLPPHRQHRHNGFHDAEHERSFLSGLVVRELEDTPSHYRSRQSLPEYLHERGIPGVTGIDTRYVTGSCGREARPSGAVRR